jgi:membrane protein
VAPDLKSMRKRWEHSFLGRLTRSFMVLQGFDRAMVISSQAFTTLIPLLIVVSAVLPRGDPDAVADALTERLSLSGDAAAAVQQIFGMGDAGSIGLVSALLLLFSGVSFTRRMQRMYQQAWHTAPLRGVQASRSAVTGLLVLVVDITLMYFLRAEVAALPYNRVLTLAVSVVASVLLWTLIPWLLLDRLIEWRRLLLGGLLTGVAVTLYGYATALYMPRLIDAYSERYGLFGVMISLVSWLLCIVFFVVAATVTAAEVDRAPQSWARALQSLLGLEPRQVDETATSRDVDA